MKKKEIDREKIGKDSSEKVMGVLAVIVIASISTGFIFGLSVQEKVNTGIIPSDYLSQYCNSTDTGFNCQNNLYMAGLVSVAVAAASILIGIHKKSDYRTRLIFTSTSWITGLVIALLFL